MKKTLSTRLNPWGGMVIVLFYVPTFFLAGAALLQKNELSSLVFFGIGLVILLGFALSPRQKYAEYDDQFLYVRGCFIKETIPLENIRTLTPYWTGKGAFWIEFKSETKFGKRVLVSVPLGELLRDFPLVKRFDEMPLVRDFLKAIGQIS